MTNAEPVFTTDRPPGLGPHGACRIVHGNTMGGIVHGSLVFYDDVRRSPGPELIGELVIAELIGQPDLPYVRFLDPGSRAGLFTLRSSTGEPMRDVRLEWVAPVLWIRPPSVRDRSYLFTCAGETELRAQVR